MRGFSQSLSPEQRLARRSRAVTRRSSPIRRGARRSSEVVVGEKVGEPVRTPDEPPPPRLGAIGRPRCEPFRERRKLSDRPVRLRGFSRPPAPRRRQAGASGSRSRPSGFNVGIEDVQKRRIIRADGRGAGRKCGHDHVTSGDPVEPVLLEEGQLRRLARKRRHHGRSGCRSARPRHSSRSRLRSSRL